ncbi:MAG: hypothetical protein IJX02_07520 [Clostridia bacterium]|nr:hypothetical protein [Clostridia bacterium]
MKMKNMECFGYERKIGKTPNGGKFCEIYYYCGCGEPCEKQDATHCIIFEKKRNGKTINTIYCML